MLNLPRWLNLGLVFPLAILNGWLFLQFVQYFQPLISIFIAAILLAFILDYPVRLLQQAGVKRTSAAWWVFLLTLLILVAIGVTLVPIILEQLNELANRLPSWIKSGSQQLQAFNSWAIERNLPIDLSGLASQLTERLSGQLQTLTTRTIDIILNTIGSALNVLLTVVLTFYLVLIGEDIWDGIFQWFPPQIGNAVRRSLQQNFHNYFIGQAISATVVGSAMTIAFLVLRVPLGLLFGLGIGLMALFPFGVGISIGIVSLLVALQNFWLGAEVLGVAFAIDQLNANLVAPRILGEFTGLNPVWILVSLLLGAKIAGLLGVLIAVPLASFIKSIAENLRDDADEERVSLVTVETVEEQRR